MVAIVQRGLRAAFMAVEAVFNRAFGDRMNPLYHLGQICFYLFWIIGATGLVLYAFFNTSVTGAYESVEAITHGAWGAGSVLRSVHRYASDAMVLLMLLHMLRNFAFDRLRGFRAFSWVTGVMLLWLVYVVGANGFMLPWDRLAQFVTQSSFEWLDWLPGFGGRLIRNFILPEHVSDRLFSLLVFVHIGVSLVLLLLMWVHVQRVPKATTQPPRPLAVAMMGMLVVLAIIAPIASQGVAELNTEPTTLKLDWFLLTMFPLIHNGPLSTVWAIVIGGSVFLYALPWLTLRRGSKALNQLTIHPGPARASARAGETLLDAGLRAGLALPFDCRSGGCGVCLCTVLAGRVDLGPYQEAALTAAMRARGQALMCCAVAQEDVEFEVEGVISLTDASAGAPRRWQASVQRMEQLSPDLMRLFIALPEGEHIDFIAGQYINIILEDGAKRAFSFANPPRPPDAPRPSAGDVIELHIRRIPGGRFTGHVFSAMKVGDRIDFEGPLGSFVLRDSARPILMLAGATGFAPIKSILEDAFRRGIGRRVELYWGVRGEADLYLQDLVARWQAEHANFRYVPVLSDIAADDPWPGRRGFVHEALLADHPDLSGHEVYACGSTRMVEAAVPDFLAHGLGEQFCFSDAFVPTASSSPPPPPPSP